MTLGGSVSYHLIYYKKDFSGYYKNVLQPLSQQLNPEWAHIIGVSAIKYGFFPSEDYEDPKVLVSFKYFNSSIVNNNWGCCGTRAQKCDCCGSLLDVNKYDLLIFHSVERGEQNILTLGSLCLHCMKLNNCE